MPLRSAVGLPISIYVALVRYDYVALRGKNGPYMKRFHLTGFQMTRLAFLRSAEVAGPRRRWLGCPLVPV